MEYGKKTVKHTHTHIFRLSYSESLLLKNLRQQIGWKLPEGSAAPPEKDALLP